MYLLSIGDTKRLGGFRDRRGGGLIFVLGFDINSVHAGEI